MNGPAAVPAPAPARAVTLGRCVAFRFIFSYFVLYSLPFPIGLIPGTGRISEAYDKLWSYLVPWVGKHVLLLPREISANITGSGDTTFNYVQLFCGFVLAVLATLIWSLVSRRRDHETLRDWFRVYVRYVLAYTMLVYGTIKIFKSQFPFPSEMRLLQPYGDSSPMALLWTFMGFSTPYTVFAGLAEALGGVLLFFRRTTTLGSLLLLASLGNVVMLNFSYDVPVKLYSVHLWLMSLLLVAPDLPRLLNALVLNRSTQPVDLAPRLNSRLLARHRVLAKTLFVAFMLFTTTKEGYKSWRTHGDGASRDPLDGAYLVEHFAINGEVVPPLVTEARCWRKVGIATTGRLLVRMKDDSTQRYRLEHDPKARTFAVWPDTSAQKSRFTYNRSSDGRLTLNGVLLGDSISVRMRPVPASEFALIKRGFHWVSEFPYNR